MIIFNLKAILQVFLAAAVGFLVFTCGGCTGSATLAFLGVPALGLSAVAIDGLMRFRQAKQGFGVMDAISPRRGGQVFFLPIWLWGGGVTALGALTVFKIATATPHVPDPGEEAFDAANNQVLTNKDGAALGNTPEAQAMARSVSEVGKTFRELAISGEDSKASLSGGEFVTYAQVDADSAAFLVHVPDLRHYDRAAKEGVAQFLWQAAATTLEARPGAPKKVAVGIRGVMLYDTVLEGEVGGTPHEIDRDALYAYFVPGDALPPLPPVPVDAGAVAPEPTPGAAAP